MLSENQTPISSVECKKWDGFTARGNFLNSSLFYCALIGFLLSCGQHTVLHQTSFECAVHSFETIGISHTLNVCLWFEDPASWILDALPDGVTPRIDGFLNPVGCSHFTHHSSCINELLVLLFRNKVWMTPVWKMTESETCPFYLKTYTLFCYFMELTTLRTSIANLVCLAYQTEPPCHHVGTK